MPAGLGLAWAFTLPACGLAWRGGAWSLALPWSLPGGGFHLGLDALSAFFLSLVFPVSILSALYGLGYLKDRQGRKALGAHWAFFYLLVLCMALLLLARDAPLFLTAWEGMTLSSYFLVTFEHEEREVRRAGLLYLVASHVGTAFLLAFFLCLRPGSLAFAGAAPGAGASGWLFLCALVGFGTKAGLVPLHVWLPEAHPAAPSHVSALMSALLVKMGIYGLARALMLLGPPPASWGLALALLGAVSAVLGALLALAQRDLKRLLAYSTVENVGLITLGLGLGALGLSLRLPGLALLGFAGALLHALNHALFKGLLFLGAGSAAKAAGSRDLERLGGLLSRMPVTGLAFLAGSAAICGLPPLNGFVGEFLLLLCGFHGFSAAAGPAGLVFGASVGVLGLVAGLAAAGFAKAFGIGFLGRPRGLRAAQARENGPAMLAPQVALALACLLLGLLPFLGLALVRPAAACLAGVSGPQARALLGGARDSLAALALFFIPLPLLAGLLALMRRRALSAFAPARAETWGCGYLQPGPRMQYTASSFARSFERFLHPTPAGPGAAARSPAVFPQPARFSTRLEDPAREGLYRPFFLRLMKGARLGQRLQQGSLRVYFLYIALTLVALAAWAWWRP